MADIDLTENGLRQLQNRRRNRGQDDQSPRRRNTAGNGTGRGGYHQERPNRRTALQNLRNSLPFLTAQLPALSALIQVPRQNPVVMVVFAIVLYYQRRPAIAFALKLFIFLRKSLKRSIKTLIRIVVFTMRRKNRRLLLIFIVFMFMLYFLEEAIMRVRKMKILRPKVRAGHRRLEWTCTCGEHLYGDFRDSQPDPSSESRNAQLDALEAQLREHSGRGLGQAGPSRLAPENTRSGNSLVGWTVPENRSTAQTGNPSIATTSGSSANSTATSASQSAAVQFEKALQLCIETGKYTIELSELGGGANWSDGKFFESMRLQYEGYRNSMFPAWARFRKPDKAIFVKFRLGKRPFVSIMSGTHDAPSIPPAIEVAANRYRYDPCPIDEPPMDSRTFFHHFYAPASDHPDSMWAPRLPWKLGPSLIPMHHGWGVYIEEQPDWPLLSAFLCLGLLISGVVAGIYGWKTGDAQTGVAIGTWLTAVLGLGTSAIFFWWR